MNPVLKEKSENGTFCVLPWIHKFVDPAGDAKLCCSAHGHLPDTTHESTKPFRDSLYNNARIPSCKNCWHHEASGVESLRQQSNKFWLSRPDSQEYFNQFTEVWNPDPQSLFYDLRSDIKCNLACIMCGPQSSSLWRQELGLPEVSSKPKLDYDDILKNAKRIDLLGGEPFLIDEYVDLLTFLADNNSTININVFTNLTALKPETLNTIKKLRNISVIVSVDSWGSTLEYHRYPLKWEKFMRNLEELNNTKVQFSYNSVASAISVLNWHNFCELEKFNIGQWSIFSAVNPPALRVENLPAHLKQQAHDSILCMTKTKNYRHDINFKNKIDYLLTQVMIDGDSELLINFIKELDQRRGINHADYLGVSLW